MVKEKTYRIEVSGESDCCGALIHGNIMTCSDCGENCDYAPKVCGYCGEELHEEEPDNSIEFCSNDCWKGYEWETFRKD